MIDTTTVWIVTVFGGNDNNTIITFYRFAVPDIGLAKACIGNLYGLGACIPGKSTENGPVADKNNRVGLRMLLL
jgi:hypothetical protein